MEKTGIRRISAGITNLVFGITGLTNLIGSLALSICWLISLASLSVGATLENFEGNTFH
jgi:hypothetical protein